MIFLKRLLPLRGRRSRKARENKKMARIAPSLLSADFTKLTEEMDRFNGCGAEILHLDVMDGHFVPNMTFGHNLVKSLRPLVPDGIFDVHLMMTNPLGWIDRFCDAGADMVTVHIECDDDIDECINAIKARGKVAGLSVKPNTPAEAVFPYLDRVGLVLVMTVEPGFGGQGMIYECLEKIPAIRKAAESVGTNGLLISVDGGVNEENCKLIADKGTDILVAGNAVFGAEDMKAAFTALSEKIKG